MRNRLRKGLEAFPFPAQATKQSEADEHPELICMGDSVVRAARLEMTAHLVSDLFEACSVGRREAADPPPVQRALCFAPPSPRRPRVAGRVERDPRDANSELRFDRSEISSGFLGEARHRRLVDRVCVPHAARRQRRSTAELQRSECIALPHACDDRQALLLGAGDVNASKRDSRPISQRRPPSVCQVRPAVAPYSRITAAASCTARMILS